ncbi:MAG: GHKL domain-containing protein [Bacteroidia bacterium]|nr:GHKL domain-containing protein [Bacteroidia bacterium]
MSSKAAIYRSLVIALVFLITGAALEIIIPGKVRDKQWAAAKIGTRLEETLKVQIKILDKAIAEYKSGVPEINSLREGGKKFSLLVYENDSLLYWSSNKIDFDPVDVKPGSIEYVQSRNNVYRVISKKSGNKVYYLLHTIYNRYINSGEYFESGFSKDYDLPQSVDISLKPENDATLPVIENGKIVFYCSSPAPVPTGSIPYFFYFIGICFYLVFVYRLSEGKKLRSWKIAGTGILLLIMVISACICLKLAFRDFFNFRLFTPELAALSDFLPSLGQLLAFILFIICSLQLLKWWVVEKYNIEMISENQKIVPFFFTLIALAIFSLNYFLFISLIRMLVLNSTINFDFNEISEINFYTIISMLAIFGLFMISALSCRIISRIIPVKGAFRIFLPIAVIVFAILGCVCFYLNMANGFLIVCLCIMSLFQLVLLGFPKSLETKNYILSLVITCGFLAVALNQHIVTKENEFRKLFANKIINNQNIENETSLAEAENELIASNAINRFFYSNNTDHNDLEQNLKYKYFSRYLKNFDVQLMRYDSCGNDITANTLSYTNINNLYNSANRRSISNYFLFIKDVSYLGGYVAKYEICPAKIVYGHVFILLKPKIRSSEYFFEDFFETDDDKRQIRDYSYAIYVNNELVKGLGSFPGRLGKSSSFNNLPDAAIYDEEGYSYLVEKVDANTKLIVAKKSRDFRQNFHIFSFLALFYLSLTGIWFLFLYIFSTFLHRFNESKSASGINYFLQKNFNLVNLKRLFLGAKIRMALFALVFFCFSAIIYFTLSNVNRTFNERQEAELDKKMALIVSELEENLNTNNVSNEDLLIKHLSNTHEVDINVFNTSGRLTEATNTRVYIDGLLSTVMHPKAYFELSKNNRFSFKQSERIGKLSYLSMYNALFDSRHRLVGYVNLPYFSKSFDLNNEFSKYLGSLLNVFTLLLLFTFLIATAISNALTRPLQLMIRRISQFKLGSQNQPVVWNQNDEIGQLVSQYNLMIKELESSTEKLARSEREGAWREMAKQVAHEIKNPLTPMKLNIQYLQLAWARQDEGMDETFKNVCTVLINQIDALSKMAEEFSSFAKMPDAKMQSFKLSDLLNESISLFEREKDFEIISEENIPEVEVNVDKVQLQRVFTNIFKNAQQACISGHHCSVNVTVLLQNNMAVIAFKDNGSGIADELKEKIFSPNFSTKTSGMGLGLAMSKKIIESLQGNMWFESVAGNGATFYISIPFS